MYSRNIFPKYGSGGLPIPENYSGNAIRRPPASGGAANGTERTVSGIPYAPPRVHTSPSRPVGLRAAEAEATVEDSVHDGVKDTVMNGVMDGSDEAVTDVGAVMTEQPMGRAAREGAESREYRGSHESHDDGEGWQGFPAAHPREGGEASAPRGDSGLGAMLSRLLPPKMGGGALAQIGLEEALLMGLFLILSQSEAEDDTLLLLALLFLYR